MANGERMLEDLEDLVGRELDGRYVLEKFIDRGGYGAVYRGTDKKFNQPVAIKVGLSSREFMKEARLAAEVKHNHIVQVSDYGSDNGLAYLVMEYLQGEDLEKLFHRQGFRLTPDQLRKFVSEVGDALAYAHADHLIHRDLKPRNIILREHVSKSGATTGNSKFVLLDFGIASKLDSNGTQRNRTQDGAGTVEYMAPELLSKEPKSTPQSDIYAFGVILYQMMVGRVPFPQSDTSHMALAECLNAISNAPPPRFREICLDRVFPVSLEELVMQCLDKDPTRRPPSMTEVRQRFIDVLDHASKPARTSKKPALDLTETIRPEDLGDTVEEDELEPARPSQEPHPRRSSSHWPWLVFSFLLILAVSLIAMQQFLAPRIEPFETLTDERGNRVDDGSPLVLMAGKSVTLTFAINDLPRDTVVEFESPVASEIVTVEMTNGPIPGTSRNFVLSVPDLNSLVTDPPPIILRATSATRSTSFQRAVKLTIERPPPWLPAELVDLKFRESPDSRRCLVGDKVFSSILDRQVAGRAVRFRLVPSTKIGDRTIDNFYVMEQLVSNALFNEFCKEQPGFEIELRKQEQRRWEQPELAESPVTDIYALEAQKFAWWLTGRHYGTLPSTTEWELAAGYWDFIRLVESKWGPVRNISSDQLRDLRPIQAAIPHTLAEVWIGLGPAMGQFQEPGRDLIKERSPYGCEYSRLRSGGRPTELTSTLIDFSSTPADLRSLCQNGIPVPGDPNLKKDYSVILRGSGPTGDEITWIKSQDILSVKSVKELTDDATEFTLVPGDFGKSEYAGFRVVMLTNADRN